MFKAVLLVLLVCSYGTLGEVVTGRLKLDDLYALAWTTDLTNQTVTFQVTAEGLGYVGFGLSPGGEMSGADIVLGGVYDDGSTYFSDRHGEGNFEPVVDESQDWKLISASENTTHTSLTFSRAFDTGDSNDIPIRNATTNIIWALGFTDYPLYHFQRGVASVNVLVPQA